MLALLCLGLAGSSNANKAWAWQGARLKRIDHSVRLAVKYNVQVPVISYHPVAPSVDSQGRVLLYDLNGTMRQITPYLGETARWQIPTGLEAPAIEASDGNLLVVSRDGTMFRVNSGNSGDITTVTSGLPTAAGLGCRSLKVNYWPDARGGVSLVSDQGDLLARYEEEIYKRKRIRGGAAVGCHGSEAFVAVAGGKLVGLSGANLAWAESPGILAGASFAPKVAYTPLGWLACNRESMCFLARAQSGVLAATTSFGSIDGVHQYGTSILIAGTDGNIHVLDQQLTLQQSIFVHNDALWLLTNLHLAQQKSLPNVVWVTTSDGHLYRADLAKSKAERVYTAPSGFATGGIVLFDGTGLLTSNFGSTHVFLLR